jgi:hypothetical protein
MQAPGGKKRRNRDRPRSAKPDTVTRVPRQICGQIPIVANLVPHHLIETQVPARSISITASVHTITSNNLSPTINVTEPGLCRTSSIDSVHAIDHGVMAEAQVKTNQVDLARQEGAADNCVRIQKAHRGRRRVTRSPAQEDGRPLGSMKVLKLNLQRRRHGGHNN